MTEISIERVPPVRLVERIAERLSPADDGVPSARWLIARSAAAAERLLARVARLRGAVVGCRPASLSDLIWLLASQVPGGRFVPEWAEPALVRAALREERGPLERPARRAGGLAWLTAAVRISRGLGPGRFWEGVRADFPQPDTSREREHLARLTAACERHLERHGLIDRVRAARLAANAPLPASAGELLLVIADPPAPLERELLEQMAARVPLLWLKPDTLEPPAVAQLRRLAAGGSASAACRVAAADLADALAAGAGPEEIAVAAVGGRGEQRRAAALLARFGAPVREHAPVPDEAVEAVAALLMGRATREQVACLLATPRGSGPRGFTSAAATALAREAGCDGTHADVWWSRLQALARGLEHEASRAGGRGEPPTRPGAGPEALRERAARARALAHAAGDLLSQAHRLRQRVQRRGAAATWSRVGDELHGFAAPLLGNGESAWRSARAAAALGTLDHFRLRVSVEVATGLWLDRTRHASRPAGTGSAEPGIAVVSEQELAEMAPKLAWLVDLPERPRDSLASPGPLDVPDPPRGSAPGGRPGDRALRCGAEIVTRVGAFGTRIPVPAVRPCESGASPSPWARPAIVARRRRAHESRRDASPPGPHAGAIGPPGDRMPRLTLSDLVELAGCPFRFLVGRWLGLPGERGARERAGLEPDAAEIFAVQRQAFSDAWSVLEEGTPPADPQADRSIGERAARWSRLRIEEARGGGAWGAPALWEEVAGRLERDMPRTVQRELDRMRRLRLKTAPRPRSRVVPIARAGWPLEISLRPDRLDVDRRGRPILTIWVAPPPASPSWWEQALLAAAAIEAPGEEEQQQHRTALRFARLEPAGRSGTVAIWTRSGLARVAERLDAVVDALASRVAQGSLFPAPLSEQSCEGCPYRRLCTRTELEVRRSKAGVPAVRDHLAALGVTS